MVGALGEDCATVITDDNVAVERSTYDAARRELDKRSLPVARSLVGSYVTSLETADCSITVCALDEPMLALWDAPVRTAALAWG